jgi:hypothetical protein
MKDAHINVIDSVASIHVALVYYQDDDEGRVLAEHDMIATIHVTPYLTGAEAREIAVQVACLASMNLSDGVPLVVTSNF